MALVDLPTSPGPVSLVWSLQDFGNTQKGALGGAAQRINRLGNRWRLTATMPVMSLEDARSWSAALMQAIENGLRWDIRQLGLDVSGEGAPVVDGASQAGITLACTGFTIGYAVSAGQFFSINTSSGRFVHQVTTDDTAKPASGTVTLDIHPQLRIEPANADTLEFSNPKIEGLLAELPSWSIDPDRLARGFAFTIEESR